MYGKTRREEAASILDGTRRDGHRPTQLLSRIKERAGEVTLDDLFKELVLRELPTNVRHSLTDKVDTLSAHEAASLADRYFDKEGKLLNATPSVCAVNAEGTSAADYGSEEGADVNAVYDKNRRRFPAKSPYTPAFASQGKPSFANKPPQQNRQHPAKPFQNRAKPSLKSICFRHAKYGEETKFCEPGCLHYDAWSRKAGNEQAGRRK